MHTDSNEFTALAETAAPIENQVERLTRAKEIASQGSFERSLELFDEEPGLLEEMVGQLQTREHGLMQEAPYLSEHDWQVLTVLELFDSPTFEHCKRTFSLAKEKLEGGGEIGRTLGHMLAAEGLSASDVLRACLLHDCGKMCLHQSILNDTHTDEEWAAAYRRYAETEEGKELASKIGDLDVYLEDHPGVRPVHIVPFEAMFDPSSPEEIAQLAIMQSRGIDTSQTLAQIIAPHQEKSGEILRHGNPDDVAAELVENHHPKRKKDGTEKSVSEEKYPVAISLVRASMTSSEGGERALDIIRIADIYDAYNSERGYKPGHPMLSTFMHILHEADRGVIDTRVAEEWVRDSLADITKQYANSFISALEARQRASGKEQSFVLEQFIEEERVAEEFLGSRGMFSEGATSSYS